MSGLDRMTNQPTGIASFRHQLTAEGTMADAIIRTSRNYAFPLPVPDSFEGPAQAVEGAFVGFLPLLKIVIIRILQALILLFNSVLIYGIFYYLVMPGHHATERIYFDYSGVANHPIPAACVVDGRLIGPKIESSASDSPNNNDNDNFPPPPWAVADLFSRNSQWEAFYDDVIPKPLTKNRILGERTSYYIEIALDLPDSTINKHNGIFPVQVELHDNDGRRLASSIRSVRYPHESHWISFIRKAVCLFPLLLGATEESRTLIIESYRHFVESSDKPLRYVTVKLLKPSWAANEISEPEPIEVNKGEVRIGKELTNLQMLLKEWFYTCFFTGVTVLFVCQLLFILLFRLILSVRSRQTLQGDESPSIALNLEGSFLGGSQADPDDLTGRHDGAQDEWQDLPQPSDGRPNTTAVEHAEGPVQIEDIREDVVEEESSIAENIESDSIYAS